jgi:hypothetical protein
MCLRMHAANGHGGGNGPNGRFLGAARNLGRFGFAAGIVQRRPKTRRQWLESFSSHVIRRASATDSTGYTAGGYRKGFGVRLATKFLPKSSRTRQTSAPRGLGRPLRNKVQPHIRSQAFKNTINIR